MTRIYVGLMPDYYLGGIKGETFRSAAVPTRESHGAYLAVIGPFQTMRGARFMASPASRNNPHIQTVADAERVAATIAKGA